MKKLLNGIKTYKTTKKNSLKARHDDKKAERLGGTGCLKKIRGGDEEEVLEVKRVK
jgi:hypothetical protein